LHTGADLQLELLTWIWVPITVFAAFSQTLRNAAQRHLTKELGTLGATLVRFLYGLPFAALWLALLVLGWSQPMPSPNLPFLVWVTFGALGQIAATALLLRTMEERNFAIGVAYSKTEIIQVAVFSIILLGDPLTLGAALAILVGTVGVTLLSPQIETAGMRAFARGWTSRAALFGIASGTCFAISAVGYRGAALSLDTGAFIAAAYTLVWAQSLQTLVLGGWLQARKPETIRAVIRAWRWSLGAGLAGALASMGWFTAMALEPAAHVRTLGLVEVLFSYLVSQRIFRESLSRFEIAGLILLVLGVAAITLAA
jgi:drug/metabolite transporter (DMT)-like permease